MTDAPADSILDKTKSMLGLSSSYDVFDDQITMFINAVFSTLQQLGVGPDDGFEIEDNTVGWSTYINGNKALNPVKTYMYLRVRMLFDPPATSFAIEAIQKQSTELEWRLLVVTDPVLVDPDAIPLEDTDEQGP